MQAWIAQSRGVAEENKPKGGWIFTENSEEPFAAKRRIRRTTTRPYAIQSWGIMQSRDGFTID
jgi:hypothetical protein